MLTMVEQGQNGQKKVVLNVSLLLFIKGNLSTTNGFNLLICRVCFNKGPK